MGIRLTFRPATVFLEKLIKVADLACSLAEVGGLPRARPAISLASLRIRTSSEGLPRRAQHTMRGIPPPGFIRPTHYSQSFLVFGKLGW
jgi:hypothetical protein